METIVLIDQADEKETIGSLFVAHSRDELVALINDTYHKHMGKHPPPPYYSKGEGEALIEMIKMHQNWLPGTYCIKPIEPHFETWKLIITESRYGRIG